MGYILKKYIVEYANAAIEPLELFRCDVGVETHVPDMVDSGVDSCFADMFERAIGPDADMMDILSDIPAYMHRGTSPPPFAFSPTSVSMDHPVPEFLLNPSNLGPKSLFNTQEVIYASQVPGEWLRYIPNIMVF